MMVCQRRIGDMETIGMAWFRGTLSRLPSSCTWCDKLLIRICDKPSKDFHPNRIMNWDAEYRSKTRNADPAGPSFTRRKESALFSDDQDVDMGIPRRNDGPRDEDSEAVGVRRRVELFPEEELKGTPLEQLTRHWMNERHAPDILPAQENLLARLLDHLRRQVCPLSSHLIISD